MQSSTFNMKIYCTIVSAVKYREIFQVYNNKVYINVLEIVIEKAILSSLKVCCRAGNLKRLLGAIVMSISTNVHY